MIVRIEWLLYSVLPTRVLPYTNHLRYILESMKALTIAHEKQTESKKDEGTVTKSEETESIDSKSMFISISKKRSSTIHKTCTILLYYFTYTNSPVPLPCSPFYILRLAGQVSGPSDDTRHQQSKRDRGI